MEITLTKFGINDLKKFKVDILINLNGIAKTGYNNNKFVIRYETATPITPHFNPIMNPDTVTAV